MKRLTKIKKKKQARNLSTAAKINLILSLSTVFLAGQQTVAWAQDWHVNNEATLKEALQKAQTGDTIILQNNIVVTSTDALVASNSNVNINGNNNNIRYTALDSIGIDNVRIDGARSTSNGGAIHIGGSLNGNITNSYFANNRALSGSAVFISNDFNGSVVNSYFVNNVATDANSGGAIRINGDFNGNIVSSYFNGNVSQNAGGALRVRQDFNGNIINSYFENNTATYGGAVDVFENSTTKIINSDFIGNTATQAGGAIGVIDAFDATIENSNFKNNTAGTNGGAIRVTGAFTNNITNSNFSDNTAGALGGAIYTHSNFTSTMSNSYFFNNTATTSGGAIYIRGITDLTIGQGNTIFYNNTAAGSPNSLYFANGNSATITTHGTLSLYDPMRGSNSLFNKQGTGLMILGGSNIGFTNFNVDAGTLLLTYDSQNSAAKGITANTSFNLNAGSQLQIVPTATGININSPTIQLDGTTTVGSDYRYMAEQAFGSNHTILTLNNPYTGAGQLTNTAGTFTLGQYAYQYDSLHWNGNQLQVNVTRSYLNPETTGGYAANAPMRTRLANKTNSLIFEHLSELFAKLKVDKITKSYLTENKQKIGENVWTSSFYNQVHNDHYDVQAGSKAKVPGLLLGKDQQISDKSFIGMTLSAAWPDYKQGSIDSTGKDIRLSLYGGTLLKNDWQFGYLLSAGFGDISQERIAGPDKLTADYDVNTYSLGFSFSKEYIKNAKTTITPFFSYEYLKIKTDGYQEKGNPLTSITANAHSQDISRVQLGLQLFKQQSDDSYIKSSLYYQGLFGDTSAGVHSYMTNTPNSNVYIEGSSVNRNAVGFDLTWGKQLSDKATVDLSLNGMYGSRGTSYDVRVGVNFKF